MKNLRNLVLECKTMLDELGIKYGYIESVTINTRAKQRWGQCKITLNSQYWENRIFSINISDRLLQDDVSDIAIKNTIIHEILHTCEGCFNHGTEWKIMADIINTHYKEYNIKTKTSTEEKGIEEDVTQYKYVLRCKKCGKLIYKNRMCDVVRYPQFYHHSFDNGELERIK